MPPERLRVLLDQGFPNPPGFRISQVDRNVDAEHLSAWRPDLSRVRTPDWVIYCEAALGGFTALVTRDFHQEEQPEEMVCLSRLRAFHVISWSERMDDPIVEWGQLLAYLPLIRKFVGDGRSQVIFLPKPKLQRTRNVHDPKEFIGKIAQQRGLSQQQVRESARREILAWLQDRGDMGRIAQLLGFHT